ncbi:hypothetical protein F3Y22_tig00013808pilonHSYRG00042 [Hibiscus syriacus]|uniref:RNase H type-1 domain-containing protein n=1 Tax=Hibiscus syriacus TaxID=106335 RepID=A0A6A3C1D4_HIBSY|nr:hypothetical protein F3Y22_tig00013808pilonHSYRG00042 [Hibiscus syriacus]
MAAVSEVIARDFLGYIMASCIVPHSYIKDAFVGKALSCLQVVTFARELDFTRVIFEGDMLTIIKKLLCSTVDGSLIVPIICDIKENSKAFVSMVYSFIGREANHDAHVLARDAYLRDISSFVDPANSLVAKIKFNFDSAYCAQSMAAVSGVIVLDFSGYIMASCTVPHSYVKDDFVAKALLCLQVVTFARELDFTRVIFEGDTLTIIKKLLCPTVDGSLITPIICDIKEYSKAFASMVYSFIGREANRDAHVLARDGQMLRSTRYWIEEAPPNATLTTVEDKARLG